MLSITRQHGTLFSSRKGQQLRVTTTCAADSLHSSAAPPSAPKPLVYRFEIPKYSTQYGQELRLVGSVPELGSWSPKKAARMQWREGHRWVLEMHLPTPTIEFKAIVSDERNSTWENVGNRIVKVPDALMHSAATGEVPVVVSVTCPWSKPDTLTRLLMPKTYLNGIAQQLSTMQHELGVAREKVVRQMMSISQADLKAPLQALDQQLGEQLDKYKAAAVQLLELIQAGSSMLPGQEEVEVATGAMQVPAQVETAKKLQACPEHRALLDKVATDLAAAAKAQDAFLAAQRERERQAAEAAARAAAAKLEEEKRRAERERAAAAAAAAKVKHEEEARQQKLQAEQRANAAAARATASSSESPANTHKPESTSQSWKGNGPAEGVAKHAPAHAKPPSKAAPFQPGPPGLPINIPPISFNFPSFPKTFPSKASSKPSPSSMAPPTSSASSSHSPPSSPKHPPSNPASHAPLPPSSLIPSPPAHPAATQHLASTQLSSASASTMLAALTAAIDVDAIPDKAAALEDAQRQIHTLLNFSAGVGLTVEDRVEIVRHVRLANLLVDKIEQEVQMKSMASHN